MINKKQIRDQLRQSRVVIPSCIMVDFKSTFNGFGITNSKERIRENDSNLKKSVTFATFVTSRVRKQLAINQNKK